MNRVVTHNLPPEEFPFTIEYRNVDTDKLVRTQTVTGPGAVLIPPAGERVRVVITTPSGTHAFPPHDSEDPHAEIEEAVREHHNRKL